MLNEYRGELAQFALVAGAGRAQRGQIHVGDRKTFERIDAFTAPRLAGYFDPIVLAKPSPTAGGGANEDLLAKKGEKRKDNALGVAVEARYTVGECIVILSAKESDEPRDLAPRQRLQDPGGREPRAQAYVQQNMKFFVARIDLAEHRGDRPRVALAAAIRVRVAEIHAAGRLGVRMPTARRT
jgi:hypothetical protein